MFGLASSLRLRKCSWSRRTEVPSNKHTPIATLPYHTGQSAIVAEPHTGQRKKQITVLNIQFELGILLCLKLHNWSVYT